MLQQNKAFITICLLTALSLSSIAMGVDLDDQDLSRLALLPSRTMTLESQRRLNQLTDLAEAHSFTADFTRLLATEKQIRTLLGEHYPDDHWSVREAEAVIKDLEQLLKLDRHRLSSVQNARLKMVAALQALGQGTPVGLARAHRLAEECNQLLNRDVSSDSFLRLESETTLGQVLYSIRDFDAATQYQRNVIKQTEQRFGKQYLPLTRDLVALGKTLLETKEHKEAIEVLQNALALQAMSLHSEHGNRVFTTVALGQAYNETHEFERAEHFARDAIVILGPDSDKHPGLAIAAGVQYARALAAQGKLLEAQASFEYALRTWGAHRNSISTDNSAPLDAPNWVKDYVHCLEKRGRPFSEFTERAREFASDSSRLDDFRDSRILKLEVTQRQFFMSFRNGDLRGQREAINAAIPELDSLSNAKSRFPDRVTWMLWNDSLDKINNLSESQRATIVRAQQTYGKGLKIAAGGDWQQSIAPLEDAARLCEEILGEDDRYSMEVWRHVSESYYRSGDVDRSIAAYRKLLSMCQNNGKELENIGSCHALLGIALIDAQQVDEGRKHLREARRIVKEHALLCRATHARIDLGESRILANNKEFDRSIDTAKHGLAILTVCKDSSAPLRSQLLLQVADSYLAKSKFLEAAEYYERCASQQGTVVSESHIRNWVSAWRSLGYELKAAELLKEHDLSEQ